MNEELKQIKKIYPRCATGQFRYYQRNYNNKHHININHKVYVEKDIDGFYYIGAMISDHTEKWRVYSIIEPTKNFKKILLVISLLKTLKGCGVK